MDTDTYREMTQDEVQAVVEKAAADALYADKTAADMLAAEKAAADSLVAEQAAAESLAAEKAAADALAAEEAEVAARIAKLQAAPATPVDLKEPTVIPMTVGPTLHDELAAAGLGDRGVYVGDNLVRIEYGTSADDITAIQKVLTAHDAEAGVMPNLRQKAFDTAMAYGNLITAQITDQWADAEIQSWTAQEIEAKAVIAGETLGADSLLPVLADHKGVTLQIYAQQVLDNASRFRKISVAAVILRRSADGLLAESVDTPEKLQAAVDALKVQARAYTDQFGLKLP